MHELKELINNGLEELPVIPQKSWILANDVHNVGSNHSLVVLSTSDFTKI